MHSYRRSKKSLGQNFLIDPNIIRKILKIENINTNKLIMEIGPGYGDLTKKILELKPKKLLAIEKDEELSIYLKKKFEDFNNIKIINKDILEVIEKNILPNKISIFGNLPSNISTQILSSLILLKKWPPWYDTLIFMFQKEVADRIVAKSGTKQFGRLSVLCNWRLNIKKHFDVSKNCFSPIPKVNSTVLSFKPKKIFYKIKNPKNLETITRLLFSNRRKMINKNFLKIFNNNRLIAKQLCIDLNKRPEELSTETFYKIAIKYEELFG